MEEPLYYNILKIDSMPAYIEFDKKNSYLKVFEYWKNKNQLVNDVILGRTTFESEFERVYRKYEGKSFLPFYVNNEDVKEMRPLAECIGYIPFNDSDQKTVNVIFNDIINASLNPVGFGIYLASLPALINLLPKTKLTRRDFLLSAGLAFSGVWFGTVPSIGRKKIFEFQREMASYLDGKVEELYRTY